MADNDDAISEVAGLGRLYRLKEAADYLRVHPKTVERWIRNGEMEHCRLRNGGPIRFTREQLLRVMCDDARVASDDQGTARLASFRARVRNTRQGE